MKDRNKIIRETIERLSKPSKIKSVFGPELTEHARKFHLPDDLAEQVRIIREVDEKYARKKKKGK